jgi:hypothetical protein
MPEPRSEDSGPGAPDIRTLREEKQPSSANEMAALVAYYVAEVATGEARQESVTASDLKKYFKQANYPLPKNLGQTLRNAAAAGYLEKAERGSYSLNPVGYNLVAHSLPRTSASGARPSQLAWRRPSGLRSSPRPSLGLRSSGSYCTLLRYRRIQGKPSRGPGDMRGGR